MSFYNTLIDSSYLARVILLNSVDISDYRLFPSRPIANEPPVFQFLPPVDEETAAGLLGKALTAESLGRGSETIDEYLRRNATVAFLVIQDDRLLFERYYNGYSRDSICTSFSVAKSLVSALVGIALSDRAISGLDDPLTKYLPELREQFWGRISLHHLVSMSSGLGYDPRGIFPWNDQPLTYYGLDLRQVASRARPVEAPGLHFHYNNYNLILLGMVLQRATGGSVSRYLEQKIWKPLGMEFPASWSLDSQGSGMEKMESGLNARAIDFAKFGRLYLHRGAWGSRQIIPEAWVAESTTVRSTDPWPNYKYLWWIVDVQKGRFMAAGNLGQYIYVAPDKRCLILRFGRGKPADWKGTYTRLFGAIAGML